jgi:predicted DNA-binding transcriptional regulator YafY
MGLTKCDRLLYIINRLRCRKNLNAEVLARECEVTERTIYRDIVSLSEARIPVYYDNGYKLAGDSFLPPLNFNHDEYRVLKTALEWFPFSMNKRGRRIINAIKGKIEASLSLSVKKDEYNAKVNNTMRIRIKSTVPEADRESLYTAIEKGITSSLTLKMKYLSIESGLKEREVEPYFIIFIDHAFYFVGFCYLRKCLRTFRIDRIIDVSVTDRNFTPRPGITPEDYFQNSWAVFGGPPVKVEIVFAGKAARLVSTTRHHPKEKITPLGNGAVKYEVTVRGTEEICRWILGLGGEAKVIKPRRLVKELIRRAENILTNYS